MEMTLLSCALNNSSCSRMEGGMYATTRFRRFSRTSSGFPTEVVAQPFYCRCAGIFGLTLHEVLDRGVGDTALGGHTFPLAPRAF